MSKTLVTLLLPLLGPFIGYFLWQHFVGRLLQTKKTADDDGEKADNSQSNNDRIIRANHMGWCLLVGIMLAVASIFFFGLNTDKKEMGAYQPPVYENGVIKPGNFNQ